MPRVSASHLKDVGPYLQLAERMGAFCEQLSEGGPGGALFELVELRSEDELATSNDEHVIAAVDFFLVVVWGLRRRYSCRW